MKKVMNLVNYGGKIHMYQVVDNSTVVSTIYSQIYEQ